MEAMKITTSWKLLSFLEFLFADLWNELETNSSLNETLVIHVVSWTFHQNLKLIINFFLKKKFYKPILIYFLSFISLLPYFLNPNTGSNVEKLFKS